MKCEDYIIMIYEYLDGELAREKETILFTHLSACAECREEFKQQGLIKNEVHLHQKEISQNLENRVFDTIKSERKTFIRKYFTRQSPVYFNYMLGGIIIIIVLLSFLQVGSLRADLNDFKGKYEFTLQHLQYQTLNRDATNIPAIRINPNQRQF